MSIMIQIGIVFLVCLLGEGLSCLLPISFPSSVISMILLFILLVSHIIKPIHIKEKTDFLLKNMAFFFIPAGVTIMENYEFLRGSLIQLLIICLVTTILTFAATAYTVKWVILIQNKRRHIDD